MQRKSIDEQLLDLEREHHLRKMANINQQVKRELCGLVYRLENHPAADKLREAIALLSEGVV